MRRLSTALIAFAAVASLALVACGGGDNNDGGGNSQFVNSSDGSITLEIPVGALPDGLEIDDISVGPLDLAQFGIEQDEASDARISAAVDLQPSGTTFSEPVTVSVRIPGNEGPELAILISDDGPAEAFALSMEIDGDEVIASVQIDHFSQLVYMQGPHNVIEFEFLDLGNHQVGETFTIRARVNRIDFEAERRQVIHDVEGLNLIRIRPSDDRTWEMDIRIGVTMSASLVSSPADFEQAVAEDQSAVVIETEATCNSAGRYEASIGGSARIGIRVIPIDPPGDARDLRGGSNYGDFLESGGRCLGSDETATPEPTSTPEPTPTEVALDLDGSVRELFDAVALGELEGATYKNDQIGWAQTFATGVTDIPFGLTISSFPIDVVPPREPSRPETGFESSGGAWWGFEDGTRQRLFANTVFPCGQGDFAFTLCPDQLGSAPDGPHTVIINQLMGDIPTTNADPDARYQYGFVFDSDGSSAGNYQANPSFPNDFFDGTDRWYTANYAPETGWTMSVSQVNGNTVLPVESAARIVILGNVMALIVPDSEFQIEEPPYRVSAFWHTGDFGQNPPHLWSGDVFPAVADGLSSNYLTTPLVLEQ